MAAYEVEGLRLGVTGASGFRDGHMAALLADALARLAPYRPRASRRGAPPSWAELAVLAGEMAR
ncbi:hypothetical protein [Streptomyces sp. ODS28]|uniref:hypothetical protein n=1 Tax=Streptomyces sp. ODS28 TaxID=3136688 RepID=UPI0031E7FC6D